MAVYLEDAAPFDPAKWAAGAAGGGSFSGKDGEWGVLAGGPSTQTVRAVGTFPAGQEFTGRFRMPGPSWPRMYLRADAGLATAKGYYLDWRLGSATVTVARTGSETTNGGTGAITVGQFTLPAAIAASTPYRFRFQAFDEQASGGVRLRASMWPDGQAEPAWQGSVVDTSVDRIVSATAVGLWLNYSAATALHYDDLTIQDPTLEQGPAPVDPIGVLQLGEQPVSGLRFGDAAAQRLYLADTLVWDGGT